MQLGKLLGRFLLDFGSKMEVFGKSRGPKNQEKSILGGVLGGLGGILGPKSQKRSATLDLKHEMGPQIGAKIDQKSSQLGIQSQVKKQAVIFSKNSTSPTR